jgi:prepilin-type N-terminal cleavage/methylation domain-containing protein
MRLSRQAKPVRDRGFTVLELLMVIALTLGVTAIAGSYLSGTFSRNELDASASQVVDSLEEARTAAMTGYSGGQSGVHFETGQFVLFRGASYSAGDPDNVTHDLSGLVSLSGIDIADAGNEIMFNSPSGSPEDIGTITLSDTTGETKVVTVNGAGLVDIQ